jgi:hypothetical protein
MGGGTEVGSHRPVTGACDPKHREAPPGVRTRDDKTVAGGCHDARARVGEKRTVTPRDGQQEKLHHSSFIMAWWVGWGLNVIDAKVQVMLLYFLHDTCRWCVLSAVESRSAGADRRPLGPSPKVAHVNS